MSKIINFLSEISKLSDFQRTYIENNLNKVLNIGIIASSAIAVITAIGFQSLRIFIITTGTALTFYLLKFVAQKGYYTLAGILTSFALFFAANVGIYIGRGFKDESLLIFPAIMVLTSLILNRYYFTFFTATSIIYVAIVGFLEVYGISATELETYSTFAEVSTAVIILIGTALGVSFLNSNLSHISQRASKSEFQFKSFFNSSPEGIFLMDLDGVINNVNKSLLNIFNVTESKILKRSFEEFIKESDVPKTRKIIEDLKNGIATDESLEIDIITREKTIVPVSIKGFLVRDPRSRPLALGAFVEDITEKKKLLKEKTTLEGQLTHVQKMEAIGTLAGGIAHDFNNILVGILGFTELAIAKETNNKINSYLEKVQHAGKRAKGLVEQILKFSRRELGTLGPVSVNAILNEVLKLLSYSLPSSVKIQKEVSLDKDIINGDETQIHQILMNICTNAYQALKADGGILKIQVTNVKLAKEKMYLNMQILPGDYICIKVSDNGPGMSPEVVERIFEPYFTTKKAKEGTGLGLSVTMGIVKNHLGLIEVDSAPGKGTTFTIYLPQLKKGAIKEEIKDSKIFNGKSENVLILDDEYYFTDVMKGFLKGMSLNPTTFNDSHDALENVKTNPDLYKCIITDLTMPNMDGLTFISEVRNINAAIPIILCTGFSEEVTEETAEYYGISKFLNKPVSKKDISNALNQILSN